MINLNNAYEHFKVRERDLLHEAERERLAQSLPKSAKNLNHNLAQVGRFLVNVGTHLVESYDEAELSKPDLSLRMSGNEV